MGTRKLINSVFRSESLLTRMHVTACIINLTVHYNRSSCSYVSLAYPDSRRVGLRETKLRSSPQPQGNTDHNNWSPSRLAVHAKV